MNRKLYTESECMILADQLAHIQHREPDYFLILNIAVGLLLGLIIVTFFKGK